jgi:hypothetical protein
VDRDTARRLHRLNAVAATAFVFGGSLFAIGAALAQMGAAQTLYCSVYLAGGICFSSGGYATVLQAVNGPREVGKDGRLLPREWHWWASEPDRLEWMSSFALFFGTVVFAINIADSFIHGLGAAAEDRLVWSPDLIGCLLFLISGFLAMREIGPGRLFWSRRRDSAGGSSPSTRSAPHSSWSPRSPPSFGPRAATRRRSASPTGAP